MHRQCQQGQGAWQEVGAGAGLCGAGGRKAKALIELDVVRGAKKNEEGFDRAVNLKRKAQDGELKEGGLNESTRLHRSNGGNSDLLPESAHTYTEIQGTHGNL